MTEKTTIYGLAFAIAVQAGGWIWWTSHINTTINAHLSPSGGHVTLATRVGVLEGNEKEDRAELRALIDRLDRLDDSVKGLTRPPKAGGPHLGGVL